VCPGTVEAKSAEQKCDTDSEHKAVVDEHADHPNGVLDLTNKEIHNIKL
jgi:hypothetical protein